MSRLGLASSWGHVRSLRFNSEGTCLCAATDDSVRIFSVDPLRELQHIRLRTMGDISKAEMLNSSNVLALVPHHSHEESAASVDKATILASNSVLVFDCALEQTQMEVTLPVDRVLNVRLKRDKLVVVSKNVIAVFSFPQKCDHLFSISTRDNPLGLCEISPVSSINNELMVFPGYKRGSVQLLDLATTQQRVSSSPVTLNAHKSELACLAINSSGTLVASASNKGTLIRIWDAVRRYMLVELRRGSDQALLYCISFSANSEWLCCASDKGTVHIFALHNYKLNRRSALASMGVPGAYVCSQWSLASFTVPQEIACVCVFGQAKNQEAQQQNTIFAACLDGSFHKYHFNANGTCIQVAYDILTQMCEDCAWDELAK